MQFLVPIGTHSAHTGAVEDDGMMRHSGRTRRYDGATDSAVGREGHCGTIVAFSSCKQA